jgi:hypothetical protein
MAQRRGPSCPWSLPYRRKVILFQFQNAILVANASPLVAWSEPQDIEETKMELHAYDHLAIDRLIQDLNVATEGWDWSQGAHGHSLSLPAREDLHPLGQDHYINSPFANRLGRCPYFQHIFDSFECDKVSFRLLRRPAGSSYTWHTDKEKGSSVVRFQIPIVTYPDSVLVVTDFDEFAEIAPNRQAPFQRLRRRCRRAFSRTLWGGQAMDDETEAFADYATFKRFNRGRFREYVLDPGVLYYFNTNKFHNLMNHASEERITLVVDCFENDWLRARYAATVEELDGSATS